jgi:predicted Ser/Thr protein kinase
LKRAITLSLTLTLLGPAFGEDSSPSSVKRFINEAVRFRTDPPAATVHVVKDLVLNTKGDQLKTINGRATFPEIATKSLSLRFGLRAQMADPGSQLGLLKYPADPKLFALSRRIELTGDQVEKMLAAHEWPLPGNEPLELVFEPEIDPQTHEGEYSAEAVQSFIRKDVLFTRAVYFGLPALCLASFIALAVVSYKKRVLEPRRELLELEKRRDEMRQTMAMQRVQNKDNNLGEEFGAYTIDKFLGAGGMARVYRAVPTMTLDPEKRVAVKIMSDSNASPEFKKRFLREADVGRSLTHPAVIRIDDYGDANGTLYLVMEFINGETLRERMGPQGMSGAAAWKMLEPVFKGLSYVHERGIIHRDLKPENIMVTETGRIIIMDFGLARRYDHSMLTATGDILGTPAYMAPEQISGNIEPGGGCDQYAISVMIYEMLSGQLPFPGLTDPVKLLMANLNNKPTPIRQIRADLSQELENALLKMLSKNPASRFESMAECGRLLEPLILAVKSPGPQ